MLLVAAKGDSAAAAPRTCDLTHDLLSVAKREALRLAFAGRARLRVPRRRAGEPVVLVVAAALRQGGGNSPAAGGGETPERARELREELESCLLCGSPSRLAATTIFICRFTSAGNGEAA